MIEEARWLELKKTISNLSEKVAMLEKEVEDLKEGKSKPKPKNFNYSFLNHKPITTNVLLKQLNLYNVVRGLSIERFSDLSQTISVVYNAETDSVTFDLNIPFIYPKSTSLIHHADRPEFKLDEMEIRYAKGSFVISKPITAQQFENPSPLFGTTCAISIANHLKSDEAHFIDFKVPEEKNTLSNLLKNSFDLGFYWPENMLLSTSVYLEFTEKSYMLDVGITIPVESKDFPNVAQIVLYYSACQLGPVTLLSTIQPPDIFQIELLFVDKFGITVSNIKSPKIESDNVKFK